MTIGRLAGLAALLSAVLLAGCSRYDVYDWLIERERENAGLTLKQVTVNDMSIYYLSRNPAGAERTLLMVHGFGANKDNWVRMAAHLPDEYRLLIPDLPGHGQSSIASPDQYTIDAQAKTINAFLDQLGAGRVHMAGNSMGGGITAFFASRYPERVATIALYSPAGSDRYPSELDKALARGHNPLIVREPGDFDELMDFVLEERPFVPWPVASIMEEKAIARQSLNDQVFQAILMSAEDFELDSVLADIEAPTLIVWGRQDRVLAPRNAEVFAEGIDQSRVVLLEGVGHVPMLEVPERSANLWVEFIEANSGEGR